MQDHALSDLNALCAQYQSGKTLPQGFYTRAELFDYEMAHVLNDTWFYARHSSELPSPGDYSVLQVGRVSVLLVRGKDNVVRAFNNVCTHRAAKLCQQGSGSMARITCPYHSWTFSLDGKLVGTRFMGPDFQKDQHSLKPIHVVEDCGLIFINLDPNPRPFEDLMKPNRETLQYHGIDKAQVALRRQYAIKANWKLSIENFTECYHCAPSHQSLTKVMSVDRTILVRNAPEDPTTIAAAERFKPKLAEMQKQLDALRAAGEQIPRSYREPLAPGYESGTLSGKMLLPPMTPNGKTIGTETYAIFEVHTGYFNLYEDYGMILSYVPQSHDRTIIEVSWFIKGGIPKPDDATLEKLAELWDITTKEDAWLTENTVDGVRSPFYTPGTLSNAEIGPRAFLDWYVGRIKDSFTGGSKTPHIWTVA